MRHFKFRVWVSHWVRNSSELEFQPHSLDSSIHHEHRQYLKMIGRFDKEDCAINLRNKMFISVWRLKTYNFNKEVLNHHPRVQLLLLPQIPTSSKACCLIQYVNFSYRWSPWARDIRLFTSLANVFLIKKNTKLLTNSID